MKKQTNQNKIKDKCDNFFHKIRENKDAFFVLLCTFIALLGITFLDVTSRETVATFALSEYQIGQIADRTGYRTEFNKGTQFANNALNKADQISQAIKR